ncbi:MAG: extracellular solute-binding protein [Caldilineaceae bacterium]|nr:extracellular solute-binding protein [Caldilineaceae bacterium]HRJ42435.1 extracellular solute-binding protein [Caldilineaceae bacterium]
MGPSEASANAQQPLIFWVPPFFSIDSQDRSAAILAAALAEFTPAAASTPVMLVPKAERGPASLLTYLRTTSRSAPKLLPDVVLLNSFDLAQAVNGELLTPLTARESALFAEISAPLLASAQVDGTLYGLPYVANLEHLAYQKDRVLSPPESWADFLDQDNRLLFAGGSVEDDSINFAWMLYLTGGGQVGEDGEVTNPELLKAVLTFLEQGKQQGLIPESAATLSSPQAVWTFLVNGNAEIAVVPAHLYYNQQSEGGQIGFAPIPSLDGKKRSVVTTWSFAIITQEPERRESALLLLQQLFAPDVQGEWSASARRIPTQLTALHSWDSSDLYTAFVQTLLENSIPLPNLGKTDELALPLQQAQRELLTKDTPSEQLFENLPLRP